MASIKEILCADPTVKSCLDATRSEQTKFRSALEDLKVVLFPEEMAGAIRLRIADSKDAGEIAKLVEKAASYEGESARLAKSRGRELARAAFSPFRKSLIPLVNAGINAVKEAAAKAEQAETQFFRQHGLPREATSVSKRFNQPLNALLQFADSLTTNDPAAAQRQPNKNSLNEIVGFFS